MKRAELFLFSYCIIGLMVCVLFSRSLKKTNEHISINKEIPQVKIKNFSWSHDEIKIKMKKEEDLAVQAVFFNSSVPDTFLLSNEKLALSFSPKNFWMLRVPASTKNRAPVYEFNNACVLGFRYLNTLKCESSEWSYFTFPEKKNDFYAASIITDPANLFDFEKGIYASGSAQLYENSSTVFSRGWWLSPGNWLNRGKKWEKKAVFQFLNTEGELLFSANCGLRIQGNATRGFPQKSFRLRAKKTVEKKTFDFDFFGKGGKPFYKSLILRNSGNDWGRTMFADNFIQSCIPESYIDKQLFIPVILYLNGIYWGLYSLGERPDEDYLAGKYNVKKKKVTIVDGETLNYGNENVKEKYVELVHKCRNNKITAFEKLENEIDIENFASYIAIQLYCVNTDLESPNIRVYQIQDSKWRWVLKDLDCSYSYSGHQAFAANMFKQLVESNSTAGVIFKSCMKYTQFKKILLKKLNYLLSGPLNKNVQLNRLDVFQQKFAKGIKSQIDRWRKPVSEKEWYGYIDGFRNFINLREAVIKKQMQNYLSFG